MPAITVTRLPGSEVKVAIVVEPFEYSAYLEEGVKKLSTERPIAGFRPGHLPMSEAKRLFGDMAIMEASLERIIRAFYVKALLSEKINAVGSPHINIDKISPDQPLEFHCITPVEPSVLTLADLSTCTVEQVLHAPKEEAVDSALHQLRTMRRIETPTDRPATKEDVITLDVEMTKAGVVIEGGSGSGYKVYLNEAHYLPSFTEHLLGMKVGDEKTFTVTFPTEHYQKHLAGQPVEVKAKASAVHEMTVPALDEAFAKSMGIQTIEELKHMLRKNLTLEAEQKSHEVAEIEMLEKLITTSTIEDAPQLLVNEEVRRMLAEMQQGVEDQGMNWDDYLTSIKKSLDDLRLDFVLQAIKRIKVAVLIKHVAQMEKIDVPTEELDTEIDRILGTLKPEDAEGREHISSSDYRDYVQTMLRNRKTIAWLKMKCFKKTV